MLTPKKHPVHQQTLIAKNFLLTSVRQVTQTSITCNAINTGALVEARARSTVVYIDLAISS